MSDIEKPQKSLNILELAYLKLKRYLDREDELMMLVGLLRNCRTRLHPR
jgi:hypothetical protein